MNQLLISKSNSLENLREAHQHSQKASLEASQAYASFDFQTGHRNNYSNNNSRYWKDWQVATWAKSFAESNENNIKSQLDGSENQWENLKTSADELTVTISALNSQLNLKQQAFDKDHKMEKQEYDNAL